MLKVIILSSVLMMGLTPFSGRLNAPIAADPDDVKTLIQGYVDAQAGKYTKKTHIHLNDAAITELKEYFHAGANAPKRRTYYDETVDALLMGDYDGGFTHINSGYAKNGDNMDHYSYNGSSTDGSDFFTAKEVDYPVNNTSPNQFFVNLSNVANESALHDWEVEGDVYTYEITSLEKEGDFYKDALLHKVFYFVAPMLLEKAYFSPSKITVEEVDSKLVISLYVDGVDLAKLDNEDGLLSQASIEKGLILN